ncbi:MAG: hypothetical protein HQK50_03955 [Oligoflexia bacterium]|nr:hypothetical protein [Oligoflexia bacterium]
MNFISLIEQATDKERFQTIENYLEFCQKFLEFVDIGLQARIVSQNENYYQFFQYKQDGNFNITRPLNSRLMYDSSSFAVEAEQFKNTLNMLKEREQPNNQLRENINKTIYTIQQSIGATLDGLPSGKSNQARKVNGDLFERLIRILIASLNVDCVSGTMQVPVKDSSDNILFKSSYQHDLLISKDRELKIIGSVKTSSKDRIDKVFLDKFLYCRLTETSLPHIAIFLNDVQRKKTKRENEYGVSATFLPGHFKAFTVKLNPLDGVYYCDIRPNMIEEEFLARYIKTIDNFFFSDLWSLLNKQGQRLEEIKIEEGTTSEE